MWHGSATIVTVRDIAKSLDHYRDALGFTVTFQYGDPTFYVCLCRDEVNVHLLAAANSKQQPGQGNVCVFVSDVDALHAELKQRNANVVKPPQDYDYGMRDFDVLDPDGNRFIFGMATGSKPA